MIGRPFLNGLARLLEGCRACHQRGSLASCRDVPLFSRTSCYSLFYIPAGTDARGQAKEEIYARYAFLNSQIVTQDPFTEVLFRGLDFVARKFFGLLRYLHTPILSLSNIALPFRFLFRFIWMTSPLVTSFRATLSRPFQSRSTPIAGSTFGRTHW